MISKSTFLSSKVGKSYNLKLVTVGMYLLVCFIYQAGMAEPGVAPPIFGRSVNPIPTGGGR